MNASSLPKIFARIDRFFHQFAPWQIVLITLTGHYMLRNTLTLLYLSGPDAKDTGYSPSFHRAALVFKAMDAGFWSTMVRPAYNLDLKFVIMLALDLLANLAQLVAPNIVHIVFCVFLVIS